MPVESSRAGASPFQWNAGAWFGAQLGGTAWLLIGATVLVWQAPAVAAVWLAVFALVNALGVWLWRHRAHIRVYVAIQLILLACGATGLLACFILDRLRPEAGGRLGWSVVGYRGFLVVPALMAWFAIMEYASRRGTRSPDRSER